MVAFDPRKRITAGQALQHRYFACDPPQTPVEKLPRAPVRASNPLVMEAQVTFRSSVLAALAWSVVHGMWQRAEI